MLFCPKCGSIMLPKRVDTRKIMACSCGFVSKDTTDATIKEGSAPKPELEVIDSQQQSLPITDAECTKCHHRKAFFWLKQTRAGDEPETKFLKCEKCSHTWRDYS